MGAAISSCYPSALSGIHDQRPCILPLKNFNMKKLAILLYAAAMFTACCDDDGPNLPPINPCMQGLAMHTTPDNEVEDSLFVFCTDTCNVDCQEIYSDAIPFDYTYPCFDPSDPERLAYFRYDNVNFTPGAEIWVVNFCNGNRKMITSNGFYSLDWSAKDWLIYTGTDQNIWKVKSGGDSLTQLTTVGTYNRDAKWNPNGTQFIFQRKTGGALSMLLLSDEHGTILDTLDQLTSIGSWSWIDSNRICYLVAQVGASPPRSLMKYYNIETGQIIDLHGLSLAGTLDSAVQATAPLLKENSIIWCGRGLIGKTDLNTGDFTIIKKRLNNEYFKNMAIRPGSNEILINKNILNNVGWCYYDSEVEFYIINSDGTNPRKILLPQ
jgi:hypothetical protein